MQTELDKEICSCEQQGHFVSINDKIIRVPEGYVVMFETGNYSGSDLKSGDMAYSKRNNRFVLIDNLDKYPGEVGSRTCVIRRYIPEEVRRLVDVAQRHAASKTDDTIIEAKENIEISTTISKVEDIRCFNSGCDDFSDIQENNCDRVFDITQCARSRYNHNNSNDIKPVFDDDDDMFDDGIDDY